MVDFSILSKAIEEGNREKTKELTRECLSAGVSPQDVIAGGLQSGMRVVGEKFSSGEYFLPEMLMAARAMKDALEILGPLLKKEGIPTIGKVVIGTVEGDMHDIGKNIVATFLGGDGFDVFDLGVNVPAQKFIDEAIERKADILGLSSLLTTTKPVIGLVIKRIREVSLHTKIKVIIGGAAVTQEFANYIGADGYADNGGKAVSLCRRLLGKIS